MPHVKKLLEACALISRKPGKWILRLFRQLYTGTTYMIATTADEIVLNPVGSVDIHGVGGSTPFFTGLLDKSRVKNARL